MTNNQFARIGKVIHQPSLKQLPPSKRVSDIDTEKLINPENPPIKKKS